MDIKTIQELSKEIIDTKELIRSIKNQIASEHSEPGIMFLGQYGPEPILEFQSQEEIKEVTEPIIKILHQRIDSYTLRLKAEFAKDSLKNVKEK